MRNAVTNRREAFADWVVEWGNVVLSAIDVVGDMTLFAFTTFQWMVSRFPRRDTVLPNYYQVGVLSLPVVALTGTFIGMVLAVQSYSQFSQIGLESRLGAVINMTLVRELGPVLAATMLAGRVGSAMAAELGTMRVTEQIDALASMGTNPIHYLVVPRVMACFVLIPTLTAMADFMGVVGGYFYSVIILGIDDHQYWHNTKTFVGTFDLFSGIIKSVFFGMAIALVSCYRGFNCKAGAEGVGRAATAAFVHSFVLILILDLLLGILLDSLYFSLWPEGKQTALIRPDDSRDDRPMVEVRDLTMQFGSHVVLREINLQATRGETLAIIGESGCGKTVLLKSIIGLLKPTGGRAFFDGRDISALSDQELARERIRFGFVFQNAALFDSLTIGQNVAFPLRQHKRYSNRQIQEQVLSRLDDVGLPQSVVRKKPAELSGGMRKRVGLARALIMKPEILLYDEPTTGLDPIMSDVINELIIRTRRRYAVTSIVVTHDMRTARKVADRVIMLNPEHRCDPDENQIIFDGPPSELDRTEDRRLIQFVRGEAGERLREMVDGAVGGDDMDDDASESEVSDG